MTFNYKVLGQSYYASTVTSSDRLVTVAVQNHRANYSSDGVTWEYATTSWDEYWWEAVAGTINFVIALRYGGTNYIYSTDAITWSNGTKPSGYYSKALYAQNKFVAVEEQAYAIYSTDGMSWTTATIPSGANGWTGLGYGNNLFIATDGYGNVSMYSTDAVTWTSGGTLPSSAGWTSSIAYGAGKYVTVCAGNSGQTTVAAYTTNGVSWTATTLPTAKYWTSVAWGASKFVAVAQGDDSSNTTDSYATSTDGITWTARTLPYSLTYKNIIYNSTLGKFFVTSTYSSTMLSSTDGITWSGQSLTNSAKWIGITTMQVGTVSFDAYNIYTTPALTETTVTSIFATNQDTSSSHTFSVAVVPSGESLSTKHYIRYGMTVHANDVEVVDVKLTLAAGDKLYVLSNASEKLSFTALGVEKS